MPESVIKSSQWWQIESTMTLLPKMFMSSLSKLIPDRFKCCILSTPSRWISFAEEVISTDSAKALWDFKIPVSLSKSFSSHLYSMGYPASLLANKTTKPQIWLTFDFPCEKRILEKIGKFWINYMMQWRLSNQLFEQVFILREQVFHRKHLRIHIALTFLKNVMLRTG